MYSIKVLSGSLRKRIPSRNKLYIKRGMNWVVGEGASGKSTLIDLIACYKKYTFNKEIDTNIEVSVSDILHVDFEFCTCSDAALSATFQALRANSSGEQSRLDFLKILTHEISGKNKYKILLVDNLMCFVGDLAMQEVNGVLEELSSSCEVVSTSNNSFDFFTGNIINLERV